MTLPTPGFSVIVPPVAKLAIVELTMRFSTGCKAMAPPCVVIGPATVRSPAVVKTLKLPLALALLPWTLRLWLFVKAMLPETLVPELVNVALFARLAPESAIPAPALTVRLAAEPLEPIVRIPLPVMAAGVRGPPCVTSRVRLAAALDLVAKLSSRVMAPPFVNN